MSSQKTEHYELNQWLATDQVLRTDFNADNVKIDAALAARNCQFYMTTYTGTGAGILSFTFPHKPMLVVVMGGGTSLCMFGIQGVPYMFCNYANNGYAATASWECNTLTWLDDAGNSSFSGHEPGNIYTLLALLDADQ